MRQEEAASPVHVAQQPVSTLSRTSLEWASITGVDEPAMQLAGARIHALRPVGGIDGYEPRRTEAESAVLNRLAAEDGHVVAIERRLAFVQPVG